MQGCFVFANTSVKIIASVILIFINKEAFALLLHLGLYFSATIH